MRIYVTSTVKYPVHLCFITDDGYALPTAVAIESLKENKSVESSYYVHIICRNVSKENIARLRALSTESVVVEIIQRKSLPVDDSQVNLVRHVSPTAIFKFFIPELLPNLSRVIYLDSDIVIQGELSGLWAMDVSSVYAGVVKDNQTVIGKDKHLKWLDFKHDAYFNSGVMLLNLDMMRADRITEKLMSYRIHGKNRFMDQDALNVVMGGKVQFVPLKYNCLNWLFITCSLSELKELFSEDQVGATPEETFDRAVVLHIGGSEKPWLCDLPYYTSIYRKYAAKIGWSFSFPKVSVIVPVYNSARYLSKCLSSILAQTLKEIEVICIDNGSTDESAKILKQYAMEDSRIRLFEINQKGAGKARNFGVSRARGKYIGFVDSDDFISEDYYKLLFRKAEEDNANACMSSSVIMCSSNGKCLGGKNLGDKGRDVVKTIEDRANLILASGVIWNKIYRRQFIVDKKVRFSEQPCAGEDKLWGFGVLFSLSRMPIIKNAIYYYRQNDNNSESTRMKGRESFVIIDFYREIREYLYSLPIHMSEKMRWYKVVKRCRDAEFRQFANRMPPNLRLEFIGLSVEAFYDDAKSNERVKSLIVSLTSFPERIPTLHHTLKSLLGQSLSPEKIVLWLAVDQFPQKLKSLPKQVTDLMPLGVEIKWCEDIKSYKKLVPSLRKYPDKCIVTADDDIIYPRFWLEKLWATHLEFPKCIIAHRARVIKHRMKRLCMYKTWPILVHAMTPEKYFVLPTTGGGVLYPPKSFNLETLDDKVFMDVAPHADDLWFWAMSVLAKKEVKHVFAYESTLNLAKGSQEISLSQFNVQQSQNDVQLKKILDHYPEVIKIMFNSYKEARREYLKKKFTKLLNFCSKVTIGYKKGGFPYLRGLFSRGCRYIIKQILPYGIICYYQEREYGISNDEHLFYYTSFKKRLRRIIKFAMPYGLVRYFRYRAYGDILP